MNESRREFIKKSCGLCASIVGISVLAPALQGCSTLIHIKPLINQGVISFSASSFIENQPVVIVQNDSLEYDIAVVKGADLTYRSFQLKCTHQDNSLVATNSGFHCNLHGSSFGLNGKVSNPPANADLKEYTTTVKGEMIEIQL